VSNPEAPWTAPFPAPFTLPWFAIDPTGTPDELGNREPKWLDAQSVPVQGWDMLTSEQLAEHETQQVFDAFLMTPPEVWMGIRDRVGLPLPENGFVAPTTILDDNGAVRVGIFDVTGHDMETYGPQQWTPGNVMLVKRVDG
jgi:hypothetical protein